MTFPLWTQELVLKAVEGKPFGPSWKAFGCAIDSREVRPGDIFIPQKGEKVNGHLFIKNAIEQGAACVILDHWPDEFLLPSQRPPQVSFVEVNNTFEALWDLARFRRAEFSQNIKIAALTGSVGKTTTKAALAHILRDQGHVASSAKSLNTKFGVPLSLARSRQDATYGVFEVGMSQKGEIAPLSELIRPTIVVITMLAPAHFAFFKNLEEIAEEKAQIMKGLCPEGTVILNHDMPFFETVFQKKSARCLTYGRHKDADLRLLSALPLEFGVFEVTAQFKSEEKPFSYKVQGIGEHFAYNTLAALLTACEMGADFEKARLSLETFEPEVRRGQYEILKYLSGEVVLLDESYNANPTSMRAALEALSYLPRWRKGRTVAVLGDMLELGEEGKALHRGLASEIERLEIDAVFTCGPLMRSLSEALPCHVLKVHCETSQELFSEVKPFLQDKDNIMVKGSLGMKMDNFVKMLKRE